MRRVGAASNMTSVAVECLLGAEKLWDLDPGGRLQPEVLPEQHMWIVEVLLGTAVTASYLLQVGPSADCLEALMRQVVAGETVNCDAWLVNVNTTIPT